jgi:hypothetical protein
LSRREARWIEFFAEFDMEIRYAPGITNQVADALSRYPIESTLNTLNVSTVSISPQVKTMIRQSLESDEYFSEILNTLRDPIRSRSTTNRTQQFELREGLLYMKEGNRLCIPKTAMQLRLQLLKENHETPIAGHLGIAKTYESLQRLFFWPKLDKDVEEFVKSGLLQPLPIPNKRWESISMDLIVQLPKTRTGFDAIVTFVDWLTKQIHLAPTTTTVTAPQLAHLFIDYVFRIHGLPTSIVSDRDPRFTSIFWKALFKRLGSKFSMSTTHHPQSDGQTESASRVVEEMLRAFTNYKQNDWDKYLSLVEFAYNNSIQASTGITPFFANYGQHPNIPTTPERRQYRRGIYSCSNRRIH